MQLTRTLRTCKIIQVIANLKHLDLRNAMLPVCQTMGGIELDKRDNISYSLQSKILKIPKKHLYKRFDLKHRNCLAICWL